MHQASEGIRLWNILVHLYLRYPSALKFRLQCIPITIPSFPTIILNPVLRVIDGYEKETDKHTDTHIHIDRHTEPQTRQDRRVLSLAKASMNRQ